MKHFWKAKRKKSPQPPYQSISSGGPARIAAGSSASHVELDSTPDGMHSFSRQDLEVD